MSGIPCPACGSPDSAVFDSRASGDFIRRRRRCVGCRHAWSTMEVPAESVKEYRRAMAQVKALRDQAMLVLGETEDIRLPEAKSKEKHHEKV